MKINFTLRKFCFLLLFLCLLSLFPYFSYSQKYDFKQYSVEQGLPQSQVLCLIQDSRDMFWGATYGGGVFRFDGKSFTIFNEKDGFANQVQQIIELPHKNEMYILAQNKLLKYNGKEITNLKSILEKAIKEKDSTANIFNRHNLSLAVDRNQELWIEAINPQKGSSHILKYNGDKFSYAKDIFKEIKNDSLVKITSDQSNNLWFHTIKSIYRYDGKHLKKTNIHEFKEFTAIPNCFPFVINSDSKNRIWIVTKNFSQNALTDRLYYLKDGKITPFELPANTLNLKRFIKIFEDSKGNLWIHDAGDLNTETGLLRYDGKQFTHFGTHNGLFSDNIMAVTEDKESNIWIATSGSGLVRFSGEKFIHFTKENGLTDEIVWSFWEDKSKNMFIGTGGEIGKYDGKNFTNIPFSEITTTNQGHRQYKSGMLINKNGVAGHFVFDGKETKSLLESLKLPKQYQFAIFRGYQGNKTILNAQNNAVILYTDEKNYVTDTQDTTLRRFNIGKYFMTDSKGNEWYMSNEKGIYSINSNKINTEKVEIKQKIAGLPYQTHKIFATNVNEITNCVEDKQGNMWFVTMGHGIAKYDRKQVSLYDSKNGLSSDLIYDALVDKTGHIWFLTQKGIDVVQNQVDGSIKTRSFGKEEGFFGEETNLGAKYEDSNGNLWFGHIKGATRYNPKEDFISTTPPKLYFTGLRLFYQTINWADSAYVKLHKGTSSWFGMPQNLVLPHTLNHVSFDFTAINYSNPTKVAYQWQLVGADKDWLPITKRSEAIYANLAPNTYTLRVRAANAEGIWTKETAEYTFTINPPYWATWWFRAICIFTLLAITYAIIQWRIHTLEHKRQELERIVKERTSEVVKQKEEIEAQRDNLVSLNQEVYQQKEEIQAQKEEVEKSYLNVQILSELGKNITSTLDTKKIIAITYESINTLMPAEGFGIGVYNEECNSLDYEGYIEKGETLPFHQDVLNEADCFSNWCFLNNADVIINDIETEYNKYIPTRKAPQIGDEAYSLVYVPLKSEDKIIGVLTIQSFKKNAYNDYDITMLRNIANYVGIAIEKASAYKFIAAQSKELSIKNEDITASINYAFRIQTAMLPLQNVLCEVVPECFIFFKPRDIVSGDFYWFHSINYDTCLIAAVDCTGHGVPGAMMSMIANSMLNKIVIDKGIADPAKILNELHINIRQSLKQNTTDSRDGMDMAICLYNKVDNQIIYAGARNAMYLVTDYDVKIENTEYRKTLKNKYILTEVRADKNPIGGFQHENERVFTNRIINFDKTKHTIFYLLSDGYEDQFGGEKDSKFSSRRFRELLLEIQEQGMDTQRNTIETTINNWQGKTKQVDDILVIGIKC